MFCFSFGTTLGVQLYYTRARQRDDSNKEGGGNECHEGRLAGRETHRPRSVNDKVSGPYEKGAYKCVG